MINRAKLRGKPLDGDCKRANRTTHEYGEKDDTEEDRDITERVER